jgi:hypothetical protein
VWARCYVLNDISYHIFILFTDHLTVFWLHTAMIIFQCKMRVGEWYFGFYISQ